MIRFERNKTADIYICMYIGTHMYILAGARLSTLGEKMRKKCTYFCTMENSFNKALNAIFSVQKNGTEYIHRQIHTYG
jgi:hypothetical protein